jgi:hypothetical protein
MEKLPRGIVMSLTPPVGLGGTPVSSVILLPPAGHELTPLQKQQLNNQRSRIPRLEQAQIQVSAGVNSVSTSS